MLRDMGWGSGPKRDSHFPARETPWRIGSVTLVRRMARAIAGRESQGWRLLRSPRLRWAAFHGSIDVLVYSLLISFRRVRFLQIGSNDGRTKDPLWSFRRYSGWSGVLVEPIPDVFERLARNYAPLGDRFRLVNAAIGATSGTAAFYRLAGKGNGSGQLDQLGSLDEALVQRHAALPGIGESRVIMTRVPCLTFASLCETYGINELELLHIDAEGSDAAILEQVDLGRLNPVVVLFEHVHLSDGTRRSTVQRLAEHGYDVVAVGLDSVAVDRSALERNSALAAAWGLVRR
jgi:FkbM family methyltransferase